MGVAFALRQEVPLTPETAIARRVRGLDTAALRHRRRTVRQDLDGWGGRFPLTREYLEAERDAVDAEIARRERSR